MSEELREAIELSKEFRKLGRKIEAKLEGAEKAFAQDEKLKPAAEAIFGALRKPVNYSLTAIGELSDGMTDSLSNGLKPVQNLEGIQTFTGRVSAAKTPSTQHKIRKDSILNLPKETQDYITAAINAGKSAEKIKQELAGKEIKVTVYGIRQLAKQSQTKAGEGDGKSWSRKRISQEEEDIITASLKEGKSYPEIQKILKDKHLPVASKSTIGRLAKPMVKEYRQKRVEGKRVAKHKAEAEAVPEDQRFYTVVKEQFLSKEFVEWVLAQPKGRLTKALIKKQIMTLGSPKDFSSARTKLVGLLHDANYKVKHGDSAIRYIRRDLLEAKPEIKPEEPGAEAAQSVAPVETSMVVAERTAVVALTTVAAEPEKPKRELMPDYKTDEEFVTHVKNLINGAGGSIQLYKENILAHVYPATEGLEIPSLKEVMAALARIFESEGLACKIGESEMWVMEK